MRALPVHRPAGVASASRGFTLIEMMVTLIVMAVVMVVIMTIMNAAGRSKTTTMNRIDSAQGARIAMDMMTNDLRSAGYGIDQYNAAQEQTSFAYVDSVQVLINVNFLSFPDNAMGGLGYPLAIKPTGSPLPFPLQGTLWAPTIRFLTGAEVVRWTLDANDDGVVSAADQTGTDAARTPNPNDYVLVREVYGDSSGGVAGNNGGSQEAVALVSRPGGTVPAMFTVYLRGSSTPWSWASGPVPPSRLAEIERVVVNVVSQSPRADSKGAYAETRYRTEIASMRNVPNIGDPEYTVDGFVFNDVNRDGVFAGTDVPLAGAIVRLGSITGVTNSLGYYLISAAASTYTLRHTPPLGYGVRTNPDSFVVTLPNSVTRSFADTARTGGLVTLTTFDDLDMDGVADGNELPKNGVQFTLTPGGETQQTNLSGTVGMFASVGSYSIAITPPDSFIVTTTNPITGTMVNGGLASYAVGLARVAKALVQGKVYVDTNKNGVLDGSEVGIAGVWVACTTDGGVSIQDYQTTDASGDYTLDVPANSPPGTTPYSIMILPPSGYYGTTTTSINGVYLTDAQVLTGKNFGVATFQIISLTASRVLSLGSADLIEKDWNGNAIGNARMDADIILGAEAAGTDQISVWFNDYNNTPLFPATRTYARSAPQSVLSIAVDTLDTNTPLGRSDLVTGTATCAAGNFFVWFCQKTSSNEGYFPTSYSLAYRTSDNGDVQSVLAADVAGGTSHDIIVGTKAGTGRGTFEVWQSNNAATPTYSRQETYPTAGGLPGSWIGEVVGMTFSDVDRDGDGDLVVATRLASNRGEILVFEFRTKTNGNRFIYKHTIDCDDEPTSVVSSDVDGDGYEDIIIGLEESSTLGNIQYHRNDHAGTSWDYDKARTVVTPGIPLSLQAFDVGGLAPRKDIVVGYRTTTSSYSGGVRIYSTDGGTLAATGSDPSGGQVTNMVPAMTVNNFNYGVKPSQPSPPYLLDLAVGVKITSTTGALVVMIR